MIGWPTENREAGGKFIRFFEPIFLSTNTVFLKTWSPGHGISVTVSFARSVFDDEIEFLHLF